MTIINQPMQLGQYQGEKPSGSKGKNKQAPSYGGGKTGQAPDFKGGYNRDPRQDNRFNSLSKQDQQKYYDGGMNNTFSRAMAKPSLLNQHPHQLLQVLNKSLVKISLAIMVKPGQTWGSFLTMNG